MAARRPSTREFDLLVQLAEASGKVVGEGGFVGVGVLGLNLLQGLAEIRFGEDRAEGAVEDLAARGGEALALGDGVPRLQVDGLHRGGVGQFGRGATPSSVAETW